MVILEKRNLEILAWNLYIKSHFATEDKNGEAGNKNKKARFFKNLTKHRNTGLSMMKNHPMHFFKNIVLENPLDDPMKKGGKKNSENDF